MAVYPEKICEGLMRIDPGIRVENPSCSAKEVNFACGCFVQFEARIGPDKRISELGFRSNGCGFMVAAANRICIEFAGKYLSELNLAERSDSLIDSIGGKPRKHCVECVETSWRSTLAEHRRQSVDEFRGESALICTCFGVTETRLLHAIDHMRLETVDDVAHCLNAGSGCGSCRLLIAEILDATAVIDDE